MPEFVMNGKEDHDFRALDSFTQGYIEAMFFTETDGSIFAETFDPENGSALPDEATFQEIHPDSFARMVADCANFQLENSADLEAAYENSKYGGEEYAGHDFWLTRNGHGAGFWDRGLGDVGDRLSTASKAYGECYVSWEMTDENDATGIVHID